MSTILTVTVNYDQTSGAFSFALSYFDGQTTWTAPAIADGGTIAFVNSGQYTMTSPSTQPFTFDTVSVVLGTVLSGMSSIICGRPGVPYLLSGIVFPALNGRPSYVHANQWCQATSAQGDPSFKDPKLGLSNTSGSTQVAPPTFSKCNCTNL